MAKRKNDQNDWGWSDDKSQSTPSTWSADKKVGTSHVDGEDWGLPQAKSPEESRPSPVGEGIDWGLNRGAPPLNTASVWDGAPSGGKHKVRRRLTLAGVVLAVLVVALTLVFFVSDQTDYMDGQVTVQQTQLDSEFKLSLSYRLDDLEPALGYAAGFLLSPDGELPVAVSDPVFISGVTSYELADEVTVTQAGDYRLLMYYYPLTDPIMRTTKPQLLQLRYTTAPRQTPDPEQTHWYDASTPTPSPSPTPTATPSPTPSPRVTPTPTPRVSNQPVVVTPTPTPSPAPLPLEPTAVLFDTYPLSTRYFYFQLTDNEKRLFSEMYDAMAAFESSVELKGSYTQEEYKRVDFVLTFDCPEILYQASEDGAQTSYRYWTSTGKLSSVQFVYSMTKAEAERTFTQVMDKIRSMQRQPGFGTSDFSKQYTIYKYLIQHNYYNKEKPFCAMANSAWLLGYSKCSGYTRALNLALRYYGIQCCEIWGDTYDNGVISPESHLWTGIKLEGSWYHCDATWDDPTMRDDPNYDPFAQGVPLLPYMNLNDDRMMRARSIHKNVIFNVPDCWNTKYNYYQTIGALIPAGSDARTSVHNALTKAYQKGDNFFVMSFESARDYQTVMASLVDYLKSWRYGSTRYNGCSWRYWAESNLLYVYNIGFR